MVDSVRVSSEPYSPFLETLLVGALEDEGFEVRSIPGEERRGGIDLELVATVVVTVVVTQLTEGGLARFGKAYKKWKATRRAGGPAVRFEVSDENGSMIPPTDYEG